MSGEVVSIHIAVKAQATPLGVTEVHAEPRRGLEGDRYFAKTGTYSETPGTGRDVTLIESEALQAITAETGIRLEPGESRRNITTRGIALNHLVGQEFRVGDVVLRGTRLCEPCDYLQKHTGNPGLLEALLHRGGLRCDIVGSGVIRVGDPIVVS